MASSSPCWSGRSSPVAPDRGEHAPRRGHCHPTSSPSSPSAGWPLPSGYDPGGTGRAGTDLGTDDLCLRARDEAASCGCAASALTGGRRRAGARAGLDGQRPLCRQLLRCPGRSPAPRSGPARAGPRAVGPDASRCQRRSLAFVATGRSERGGGSAHQPRSRRPRPDGRQPPSRGSDWWTRTPAVASGSR
jgi:hypothetical protein